MYQITYSTKLIRIMKTSISILSQQIENKIINLYQ